MRKSTEKQQSAVRYCEQWLYIEFDGNIESFKNKEDIIKALHILNKEDLNNLF